MLVVIPSFRTARHRNAGKYSQRQTKKRKGGCSSGGIVRSHANWPHGEEKKPKNSKTKKRKKSRNNRKRRRFSKPAESDGLPGGYRASNPTDPWRHRPAGPCSAWRRSDPAWKKTAPDSRSLRLARICRWLRPVQVVNFFVFVLSCFFFPNG